MLRVMIADDNVESTKQLAHILTKEEKNIEIVNISNDGVEAFENYLNLQPDVLLLDLDMPRFDWCGVNK